MKNQEYYKKYHKEHYHERKQYFLDYYEKNKAHKREYANKYSSENREKIRSYSLAYRRSLRATVLELLGGCCKSCGFNDRRALQVDHVNSDGSAERKIFGSGSTTFLKKVIASVTAKENRYQILCANCNMIKVETHGERKPKSKL